MMSRKTQIVVVVIIALALGITLAVPALAASSSGVYSFTNDHRAANGLSALKLNGSLSSAAQSWSEHMSKTGKLEHNPNRPGWENVGMSCGSNNPDRGLQRVMQALVESPSHNKNMLGDFTDIGVGYAYNPETDCTWVTQNFTKVGGGDTKQSTSQKKQKTTKTPTKPIKGESVKEYKAKSTTSLNVRSGPGTSYSVVTHLKNGEEVTVYAKNSDNSWVRIGEGKWVSRHYLTELSQTAKSKSTTKGKNPESEIETQQPEPQKTKEPAPEPKLTAAPEPIMTKEAANVSIETDKRQPFLTQGETKFYLLGYTTEGNKIVASVYGDDGVQYVFDVARLWMIPL